MSLFDKLTAKNFAAYAIKHYDDPQCEDMDDFYEDLQELMDELGLETQEVDEEEEEELDLEEVIKDLEEDLMLNDILKEMGYEPTY